MLPVLSPIQLNAEPNGSSRRLNTGTEVLKVICTALNSRTKDPMNSQNSRDHNDSSGSLLVKPCR